MRALTTRVVASGVLALGLATAAGISGAGAKESGRPFTVRLTGAAEVPGPGDPDGSGTANLRLNPGKGEVCYELKVSHITLPAMGAHIHRGSATESGAVVAPLKTPGADGASSGCTPVSKEVAQEMLKNPEQFYVNVHAMPGYAAGAVRGQLSAKVGGPGKP